MKIRNKRKEKRIEAIIYFCKNTNKLSETKLYKLLYFLDFLHFKEFGKPVTDLEYYAWEYGPVPTKLFYEIKDKKAPAEIQRCLIPEINGMTGQKKATYFKSIKSPDLSIFTRRENDILEKVAYIFKDATAKQMTEITHLKNKPWDKTIKEKGENAEIDFLLAIDGDAKVDKEMAAERYSRVKETERFFGLKD